MEEERENEYVDEKEEKMSISHEHFNAMLERLTGRMHPLTGWFPSIDDALELTLNPVEIMSLFSGFWNPIRIWS